MFDIGWTELLVIAMVTIIVVGPKDLPRVMRTIAQTIGKLKRMAGEFQNQFDQALKEAELDTLKKDVESIKDAATFRDIREGLDPLRNIEDRYADPGKDPLAEHIEADLAKRPAPSGNPSPSGAGSFLEEILEPEEPKSAPAPDAKAVAAKGDESGGAAS